jgi:hypothetical protein
LLQILTLLPETLLFDTMYNLTPKARFASSVGNGLFNSASLDLHFAKTKSLVDATTGANLVDFTRASSGTYVDSQGVIRTATTNLRTHSESILLANGYSSVSATLTSSSIVTPTGASSGASLLVPDSGADTGNSTSGSTNFGSGLFLTSGVVYTSSIFVKSAGSAVLRLRNNAAGGIFDYVLSGAGSAPSTTSELQGATIQSLPDGWYRCSWTYTAKATAPGSRGDYWAIKTDVSDGTSGIYLWGAQLEQSTTVGEYIPTTSTINSAPRFDHDPTTGESLGLLVEEQRSNIFLQSERIDQSPWTLTLASVVAETSVLPNGGNSAYKLVPDSGSGAGLCRQNPTLADNTVYTISIFAKAAGFSQFFIQLFDKAGTFAQSRTIDLSTGGVSGSETGSSITSAVNYGNGWYRLILANVNSLSGATTPNVRFRVAGTGDGTSGIYFWGAQLEAGAFPTSYIPTSGTTATRAADVASISGSNFSSWYRQDEGTVFADVVDRLSIGAVLNAEPSCSYVRRLTYWPARLPNETLQTITQ